MEEALEINVSDTAIPGVTVIPAHIDTCQCPEAPQVK